MIICGSIGVASSRQKRKSLVSTMHVCRRRVTVAKVWGYIDWLIWTCGPLGTGKINHFLNLSGLNLWAWESGTPTQSGWRRNYLWMSYLSPFGFPVPSTRLIARRIADITFIHSMVADFRTMFYSHPILLFSIYSILLFSIYWNSVMKDGWLDRNSLY